MGKVRMAIRTTPPNSKQPHTLRDGFKNTFVDGISHSARECRKKMQNEIRVTFLYQVRAIKVDLGSQSICAAFPNDNFTVGESQHSSIFTQLHDFLTRWRRRKTKRPAPSAPTSPSSRPRRITQSRLTSGRARREPPRSPASSSPCPPLLVHLVHLTSKRDDTETRRVLGSSFSSSPSSSPCTPRSSTSPSLQTRRHNDDHTGGSMLIPPPFMAFRR